MGNRIAVALAAAVALAPAAARAIDVADGKLSINGNGGWAYLRTDHNLYGLAEPQARWDTAMFDLLLSARPMPDLVLNAQIGFDPVSGDEDGDGVSLEWAFAEWRFSDLARLRAGKVKQPFGNYAELQFVGTARPFYTLPQGIYGPSEMAAESYWGVGLTGEALAASGWGLQWDVYGGALGATVYEPWRKLETPPSQELQKPEDMLHRDLLGARLSLLTPWDVTLRASGFHATMQPMEAGEPAEKADLWVAGLSLFYRGEVLWLSAEAFGTREPGAETQRTAYLEAAVFLWRKLQLAARGETVRVSLPGVATQPLLQHDEVAVGLNWWFDPSFVVKVSGHAVRGKRFTQAVDPGTTFPYAEPTDRTNALVIGTQFTF